MTDELTPMLVGIIRAKKDANLPEYKEGYCSVCKRPSEEGFGHAGGGYGPYTYCSEHGVQTKSEET